LLGQAISAGKSVAQNSANWTKGSDTATSTDLRIQNGLLDAATVLKSIDATQGVEMSKYGIKMTKVNENGDIFYSRGITFEIRTPFFVIDERCQIHWYGKKYRIISVEPRQDNQSVVIYTELINE
jgi:hypothetical protein